MVGHGEVVIHHEGFSFKMKGRHWGTGFRAKGSHKGMKSHSLFCTQLTRSLMRRVIHKIWRSRLLHETGDTVRKSVISIADCHKSSRDQPSSQVASGNSEKVSDRNGLLISKEPFAALDFAIMRRIHVSRSSNRTLGQPFFFAQLAQPRSKRRRDGRSSAGMFLTGHF